MLDIDNEPDGKLEEVIHDVLSDLIGTEAGTDEYTAKVKHLTDLYKLKEIHATLKLRFAETAQKRAETDANARLKNVEADAKEKEMNAPRRVSPDTVALIAANLVGIGLILSHERLHVVASKAIGFVMKMK